MPKFQIPRSPKLDFFYFLIFTIIILIIFSIMIFGPYYDQWRKTIKMEQYYKGQAGQQ
jgi:hypothetical protein